MADENAPLTPQSDPSSQEDTQNNGSQTPPATDSGHGEGGQVSTPDPITDNSGGNYEEIRSRLEGKLRSEQEKYGELDERYQNVVRAVADDPDVLKRVYMKANGLSEEEAIARVRQVYPQYGAPAGEQQQYNDNQPQHVPSAQQAPGLDPYERAALARMAQEERQKSERIYSSLTDFDRKYPDYDYPTKKSIATEAQRLVMQGKDIAEALEEARLKIAHPDQYTENGVAEGMARAYSSMGQSTTGANGGSRSKSEPAISREDEEVMKALGLNTKEAKETFTKYAAE